MASSEARALRRDLVAPVRRARWVAALRGAGQALLLAGIALAVAELASLWTRAWPGPPWPIAGALVASACAGALWGLVRAPSADRVLHAVDRTLRTEDVLLCSWQLLRQPEPETSWGAARALARAGEVAAGGAAAAAVPLRVTSWVVPAATGVLVAMASLHVPAPPQPPAAAAALSAVVPAAAPDVPLPDPLAEAGDREVLDALREALDEAREASAGARDEHLAKTLEEIDELVRALEEGRLEAGEALARSRRALAALRERGDGDGARAKAAAKRMMDTALRALAGEGGAPRADEADPSAVMSALAKMLERLAREDPERAAELARALSRALADDELARLLDKRDRIDERAARAAKSAARSAKERRRLKRLRERRKRLDERIDQAAGEAQPALEQLRRDLDPENEGGGERAEQSPTEPSGSEAGGSQRQPNDAPSGDREAERGSQQGAGQEGGSQQGAGRERGADGQSAGAREGARQRQGSGSRGGGKRAGGKRAGGTRQGAGARGAGQEAGERAAETMEELSRDLRGDQARQGVREGLERVSRRLRRSMDRRAAQRRAERFAGQRAGAGGSGPSRLRRGGSTGSGRGRPGAGGQRSGKAGAGVGDGHQPDDGLARGGRKGRTTPSRVNPAHGDGSWRTHRARGAQTSGRDGRGVRARFDPDAVDHAIEQARIPRRYRETVRSFFALRGHARTLTPTSEEAEP